jgi:hypothetical protein
MPKTKACFWIRSCDSAWRAKYALDAHGKPIPFDIIKEELMATHPFKVFSLRAMLVVSYFEKALYELPEEDVTAEKIQALADEIEVKIQGGMSARPLLSVPHVISDEASCYYHGYTVCWSWLGDLFLFVDRDVDGVDTMKMSWKTLSLVQFLLPHTFSFFLACRDERPSDSQLLFET